jgi:hypothetical protein
MKSCLKRNRPSDGSVVSAHADVSSNPSATNAAKHCWTQNAAKWFDRNQVRSRKPRGAEDVDPPIQNVPVWATNQGGADETVDDLVAGFTKRFSRKLVQEPKVSIQSAWRYFGLASIRIATGVPKMSLPAALVLDPNRIPALRDSGGRKRKSRCGSGWSRIRAYECPRWSDRCRLQEDPRTTRHEAERHEEVRALEEANFDTRLRTHAS